MMITNVNQKAAMEAEILRGEENANYAKTTLLQNHAMIIASDPAMVDYLDNVIDSFSSLRLIHLNSSQSSHQNTADLNRISRRKRSAASKGGLERKTYHTHTPIVDDGFSWKKFGQKSIKNFRYKRNYFRCQNCEVTKYEQKIEDSPPVFETIYNGQHICQAPAYSLNPKDSSMLQFQNYSQAASGSNLPSLAVNQETIQEEAVPDSNLSSLVVHQETIQEEAVPGSNLSSLVVHQETIQEEAVPGSNLSSLVVYQETIQEEAVPGSNLSSLVVYQEAIQEEVASGSNLSSLVVHQETIQDEAASGSYYPLLADHQVTIEVEAASGSDNQERIQVEAVDPLMADEWFTYFILL